MPSGWRGHTPRVVLSLPVVKGLLKIRMTAWSHKVSFFSPKTSNSLSYPRLSGIKSQSFFTFTAPSWRCYLSPSPPGLLFNFAMGLVMEDRTAGPSKSLAFSPLHFSLVDIFLKSSVSYPLFIFSCFRASTWFSDAKVHTAVRIQIVKE